MSRHEEIKASYKQLGSIGTMYDGIITRTTLLGKLMDSLIWGLNKELAAKYFPKGAGYLLSFGFDGTEEQLDRFIRHLNYFSYHVNIGDVRSLIVNSPKTTHAELDEEHRRRAGIEDNLVRISAGLENADDLISDLREAFDEVFA